MRITHALRLAGVVTAAGLVLAACGSLDEPQSGSTDSSGSDTIKVGLVVPVTGNLSAFGEPDQWVAEQMTKWFADHPIEAGGQKIGVDIVVKDSQSDPKRAGQVAAELINSDNVDVLMALSTPETTVPVTQQCEANAVTCITGDTPWQPWFYGAGGKDDTPLKYSHHFFWGLEDLAAVMQDMWDQVDTNKKVGIMFPNDSDGTAFSEALPGMVKQRGYTMDDPGRFPLDTQDFSAQIAQFKANGDEIFMGVLPPPVFAAFWQQAKQQGWNPKVVTAPKSTEFPSAVEALGDLGVGIGVEVWWSPTFPTTSSLTGQTSAEYAQAYTDATSKQWTMPLAYPEVLFEVLSAAVQKAGKADGPSINTAMEGLKVDTLIGTLDWSSGPNSNVAKPFLVSGQWSTSSGGDFPLDLTIVANSLAPDVPTAGTMQAAQ